MKFCKYVLLLFMIIFLPLKSLGEIYVIDATKNSSTHNNNALQYLDTRDYAAAIQEFKIAIALNPNSQITATYFDNLGRTYMKIFQYSLAQDVFENAIRINPMCFQYYLNLANSIGKQGKPSINREIAKYKAKKHSISKIMIGLLYIQKGDTTSGRTILDEFCSKEPSLIVTSGVAEYLKTFNKKLNKN